MLNGAVLVPEKTANSASVKICRDYFSYKGLIERIDEEGWLGDKDSNLGSQIQSLTSYH